MIIIIVFFANNYINKENSFNGCKYLPALPVYWLSFKESVDTHQCMTPLSNCLKTPTQQNVRLCHKIVDNENILFNKTNQHFHYFSAEFKTLPF